MTVIGHGYDSNVGAPIFRNALINGAMNVKQRGTSFPITATNVAYTLDRWYGSMYGSGGPATFSNQTTSPPTNFQNFLRIQPTTTTSTNTFLSQSIETSSVIPLVNKNITLSFWYKIPTNFTGSWKADIVYGTGTDTNLTFGVSSTSIATYTLPNTTTWSYVTLTGFLPSSATSLAVLFTQTNNIVANAQFDITGVQLEAGSIATPFEFEPFETTLRKCMRYYQTYTNSYVAMPTLALGGVNYNIGNFYFSVYMRIGPNVTGTGWTAEGHHTSTPTIRGTTPNSVTFLYGGTDYRAGICLNWTAVYCNAEL